MGGEEREVKGKEKEGKSGREEREGEGEQLDCLPFKTKTTDAEESEPHALLVGTEMT